MNKLFIGMPVYNGERYLRQALDSLLSQTYKDFTILISENASTDASATICAEYASRDQRVQVVHQPQTMRPADQFQFLLSRAAGEFFMWAACDDIWHPNFAARLVGALTDEPTAGLAFCPYYDVDADGHPMWLRRPSYAGPTPEARLARLCLQWDDCVFYGVFRRRTIENVTLPTWWGFNREIPMDVAFPPLCYALSRSGYVLVGGEPLWWRRLHNHKSYSVRAFRHDLLDLPAQAVRLLNVQTECARQAYRGDGSWQTAMTAFFGVGARLMARSMWNATYRVFDRTRAAIRSAA